MSNKTYTCIIPARGGSKRIPKKNTRDMCGKPLIAWTIEAAQKSGVFKTIWVNSDDELILSVANNYGAMAYKRPLELAADESSTECVIMEQLENFSHPTDYVMVLQPTSPTRTVDDIKDIIRMYRNYPNSNLITTIERVGNEWKRNGSIFLSTWNYMAESKKWSDESGLIRPTIDIDTEDDWKEAECLLKTRES